MNMLQYFGPHMTTGTLYRLAAGTTDDEGDWAPGAETNSTIQCVKPQPVKPSELQLDSDGESISDFVKTYCDSSIDIRVDPDADQLTVNGQRYKVHQIGDRNQEGEFYVVYLRRV